MAANCADSARRGRLLFAGRDDEPGPSQPACNGHLRACRADRLVRRLPRAQAQSDIGIRRVSRSRCRQAHGYSRAARARATDAAERGDCAGYRGT